MKRVKICLLYAAVALLALVSLPSLGYTVVTSLVPFRYVNKVLPLHVISLDNYKKLLENYPTLQWYVNTVLMTVLALAGNIVTSLLAGYALVRLKLRGQKFIPNSVLIILMIPFQPLLTPLYATVASLGWHNTIKGLVISSMASGLSVFMARQFYLSIPDELIEAARVNGLRYIGPYFRVVLSLSGPLTSILAILNFTSRWNAYLVSSTFLVKTERFTLVVGLNTIKAANFIQSNETMAGVVLLSLPVLIAFLFLQRRFTEGIVNPGIRE